MSKINKITPLTNVKFLNLYELEAENKFGNTHPYYVASRKDKNTMMAATKKVIPDGVVIYSLFGGKSVVIPETPCYNSAVNSRVKNSESVG